MPTVPWIRLYHNWPRHRKTMALRRLLGTAEPILCLWLWAAENAPDGFLGAMSHDDIESAAEWRGERGKAASALVEAGFVDVNGNGTMTLHNWGDRTGAGVSNLLKTRERQRELMRNKRANVSANKDETLSPSSGSEKNGSGESKSKSECAHVSANSCACSGGECLSPTLCDSCKVEAIARKTVADLTKPRDKIRPRTADTLEHCLRVAIQREQPENGIWNPGGSFAAKEAREFLEGFGADLEAALPTIEARIELFAKDKTMSPWTIAKFAKAYNGIGQAKPEARQPFPAQRQAVYPKLPRAAS